MKYLCINLIIYLSELYEESHQTLMNEMKELNKWRDITCPWIGRLYCENVTFSLLDLQIQSDSNKNPSKLFHGYQKTYSKVYTER